MDTSSADFIFWALRSPEKAQETFEKLKAQLDELKKYEGAEKRARDQEAVAKEVIDQAAAMNAKLAQDRAAFVVESQRGAQSVREGTDRITKEKERLSLIASDLSVRETALKANEAALKRAQDKLASDQAELGSKVEKFRRWHGVVKSLDVSL